MYYKIKDDLFQGFFEEEEVDGEFIEIEQAEITRLINEQNTRPRGEIVYHTILKELQVIDRPQGIKIEWNSVNNVFEETATEEEITTYIGNLVTDLLYESLEIGCEVTVNGEKHQQTLADEKRRALLEKVSGIDLKIASGKELSVVAWPFKDDGSDTVVMSVEDFRTMALYCFDYGDNCYIAAELLKAKRKVNSTIDDFYNELKNVDEISLANL